MPGDCGMAYLYPINGRGERLPRKNMPNAGWGGIKIEHVITWVVTLLIVVGGSWVGTGKRVEVLSDDVAENTMAISEAAKRDREIVGVLQKLVSKVENDGEILREVRTRLDRVTERIEEHRRTHPDSELRSRIEALTVRANAMEKALEKMIWK